MLFCFSTCSVNEDNQIRFLIPEIKMTLCFKSDIKDTARVRRAKRLAEQVQSSSLDLKLSNICLDIPCVLSYPCFNLWQSLDTFKCYIKRLYSYKSIPSLDLSMAGPFGWITREYLELEGLHSVYCRYSSITGHKFL